MGTPCSSAKSAGLTVNREIRTMRKLLLLVLVLSAFVASSQGWGWRRIKRAAKRAAVSYVIRKGVAYAAAAVGKRDLQEPLTFDAFRDNLSRHRDIPASLHKRMFKEIDLDGDGLFTREEIQRAARH